MEIRDLMCEMVGYLCVDYQTATGMQRPPVGTGFFVTVFHDAAETIGTNYLVTAKHVWADWLQQAKVAYVRLNDDDPAVGAAYVPLHRDWKFHPDPAIDLAVLPWKPVEGCSGGFSSLGVHVLSPQPQELINLKAKKLSGNWPPEPGTPVYMIGLLTAHAGSHRNLPIVRVGHLAMVASEPIHVPNIGTALYHLADLQTYPGHSGAPVWVELGDALYLLGAMTGGFGDPQAIITKKKGHKAVIEEHTALGISLITPVERLQEILMSEEMQAERKRDAAQGVVSKVVPTGVKQD